MKNGDIIIITIPWYLRLWYWIIRRKQPIKPGRKYYVVDVMENKYDL